MNLRSFPEQAGVDPLLLDDGPKVGGREAEFRQIKKDLFFGYRLEGDIFVAEPEKALLDDFYSKC